MNMKLQHVKGLKRLLNERVHHTAAAFAEHIRFPSRHGHVSITFNTLSLKRGSFRPTHFCFCPCLNNKVEVRMVTLNSIPLQDLEWDLYTETNTQTLPSGIVCSCFQKAEVYEPCLNAG